MDDRMDEMAKSVAEHTTRRHAVAGFGALALGALGIVGLGQRAEAKNDNNDCQQCKKQCKKNNKKAGKKHPTNCSKKCNDKCKNN